MHNFGGGWSDLFNSGGTGDMVKRGEGGGDIFQNSGGSWLKGEFKKFRGVWTLDEAMVKYKSCQLSISALLQILNCKQFVITDTYKSFVLQRQGSYFLVKLLDFGN